MSSDNVWKHFEGEARDYDDLVLRIIAGYQEQHQVIAGILKDRHTSHPIAKALDLGCGTGALSLIILDLLPEVELTAMDFSAKMLAACDEKISQQGKTASMAEADIATADLGFGFDAIVSGLAIHHLDDKDKALLYQRIATALKPGGIFINRDVFSGETAQETASNALDWRRFMRSNGEDDLYWFNRSLDEDKPAKLSDQQEWLRRAGLSEVKVYWQKYQVAVFGGIKPA